MAEYSGNVGNTAVTLFASGSITGSCTVQNIGISPLFVRVSTSDAIVGSGFVLSQSEGINIQASSIPAGAKISAIRDGNAEPVYAVGA